MTKLFNLASAALLLLSDISAAALERGAYVPRELEADSSSTKPENLFGKAEKSEGKSSKIAGAFSKSSKAKSTKSAEKSEKLTVNEPHMLFAKSAKSAKTEKGTTSVNAKAEKGGSSNDSKESSSFPAIAPPNDTCPGPSPVELFNFNNLITVVESERSGVDNPNLAFGEEESQKNAAIKAEQCLDLTKLTPDYSIITDKFACLPAYCEAITTAEDCQAAFYKGCSYCSGSCVVAAAIQKAVINCVREAYADADPNKVNGKVPPLQTSFVPASEIVEFQNMAGLSTLTNVIGGEEAVMFWGVYRDSRPPEKRVPIHVHPLGGYTCVNKGPVAMEIQGAPTIAYQDGECFNMQAFMKMTQAPPHDGYTVTDNFYQNSCLPTWVVIEESAYDIQDQQFGISSDLVCPN